MLEDVVRERGGEGWKGEMMFVFMSGFSPHRLEDLFFFSTVNDLTFSFSVNGLRTLLLGCIFTWLGYFSEI
jgi:hypothetical protein